MQAHHLLALGISRRHDLDDLLERHPRAVMDGAGGLAGLEQLGVHEASGPDHDVGLGEQALSAHGDEVGGAGAGANEVDHAFLASSPAAGGRSVML